VNKSKQTSKDIRISPLPNNTGVISDSSKIPCSYIFSMNGILHTYKVEGKAIPLQAWIGPEGSRRLRLPDFKTIGTGWWYGCQPYAPAACTPQQIFLVLISVRG